MNTSTFKLKNEVVEQILQKKYNETNIFESEIRTSGFGVYDIADIALNPIQRIIRALLGGDTRFNEMRFELNEPNTINPQRLQMNAPSVRYTNPAGLQLSRASTIA